MEQGCREEYEINIDIVVNEHNSTPHHMHEQNQVNATVYVNKMSVSSDPCIVMRWAISLGFGPSKGPSHSYHLAKCRRRGQILT